jgi:hypothetical protein
LTLKSSKVTHGVENTEPRKEYVYYIPEIDELIVFNSMCYTSFYSTNTGKTLMIVYVGKL